MRHRKAGLVRALFAHLEAPLVPPGLDRGGHGAFLAANVAHRALVDAEPVSPALTCVMLLTIAFFGTYLAMVVARFGARGCAARATAPEALLAKAVGALPLAPMLAVLLVCARLRELQDGAIRQPWLQLSLCVSTGALLLRIGVAVASAAAAPAGAASRCLAATDTALSSLLYGSCAVIVVNVFTPFGSEWASSMLGASYAALRCAGVIVVAHLGEQLLLELLGKEGGPKSSQVEMSSSKIVETMSLQLPLMLCVLFAGIQMRAMQLAVVPALWARAAMCATTAAVVIQAVCAGSAAVASRRAAPRLEAFAAPAGGPAAAESASAPRGAAEGGSSPVFLGHLSECGVVGACCTVSWALVVACLYIGTGTILASVFMMEAEPLDAVLPASMLRLFHVRGLVASTSPPVSPALQCVVVLTATSFVTYLCLTIGFLLRVRKWATVVVDAVGRALAFVPMLCVMMIALRLRAMHLGLPDPPPWAQTAMWVATASVVVQVMCSLFMCVADGEALDAAAADEGDAETPGALVKVVAIALTALRYLAASVLYVSAAVLIGALVAM